MSRQVVVLANHRTGSSLVAGILDRLGVMMGEELLGSHPSNPTGHYEDMEMLTFNDKMVQDWKNPRKNFDPEEFSFYRSFVEKRDREYSIWGVKDPRLCILGRHLIPLLSDPRVVYCERPLLASIRSLASRDRIPLNEAETILATYQHELEKTRHEINEAVDGYVVRYEGMVEGPELAVAGLVDYIYEGLEKPPGYLESLAVDLVNPNHKHF